MFTGEFPSVPVCFEFTYLLIKFTQFRKNQVQTPATHNIKKTTITPELPITKKKLVNNSNILILLTSFYSTHRFFYGYLVST